MPHWGTGGRASREPRSHSPLFPAFSSAIVINSPNSDTRNRVPAGDWEILRMNKARLKHLLIGEFSVRRCIRSFLLIYACVMAYAFLVSNRMIFPARPATYKDSAEISKLKTEDGIAISAIYLQNPAAPYTVLYSHGNAEDLAEIQPFLAEYHRRGYSILAYDYHGYGTSGGRPTEANAYRDIKAAYDFLIHEKHVPANRLVLHGRSVGTGPALQLASESPVAGLISESGFVSAFRVLTHIRLLPFDRFPNLRRIQHVSCPILLIHGEADTTIPIWHSQQLFAAAPSPKYSCWVPDATHDDLPWSGEAYWNSIKSFNATLTNRP